MAIFRCNWPQQFPLPGVARAHSEGGGDASVVERDRSRTSHKPGGEWGPTDQSLQVLAGMCAADVQSN
jgi:hypothetical protein